MVKASLESNLSSIFSRLAWRPIIVDCTAEEDSLNAYSILEDISLEEKQLIVKQGIQSSLYDRAMGSMVGLAVGDACGAPLEFLPAADKPGDHSFNIQDNIYTKEKNSFYLERGQWTDDSSMALCMADSLICHRELNCSDIRKRFWNWWNCGYNNAFRKDEERSHSVGLGGNIANSLRSLRANEEPTAFYEDGGEDAGNGSLMRLSPIPIFFHSCPEKARKAAYDSSRTTHPGPIAAEACKFLAHLIVDAFTWDRSRDVKELLDESVRKYLENVLTLEPGPGQDEIRRLLLSAELDCSTERNWNWRSEDLDIRGTLLRRGYSYNGYPVSAAYFGSFSVDGLAIALHSFYHTESFGEAIEKCVNHLGDADTTAAITGQIAGAFYGYSGIEEHLKIQLQRWDDSEIAVRAALLVSLAKEKESVIPLEQRNE
ncbi:hypothetical protein CYMTET_34268 [Cymbomonas tetramitiformis]|uniref:ADP-ribosylglycohydrolase n=1 Tax=Cymbomonas tetramitiformis TaxID=36881 RepID=A0AAE0FB91_9CHLO|nr:hypothetical protein CYMTET_46885 [Cymbomonas tetramitiformis]KAK3256601.1 hypothetical protein CYMTET_34268 [Cymbomonas tetramitiformis]